MLIIIQIRFIILFESYIIISEFPTWYAFEVKFRIFSFWLMWDFEKIDNFQMHFKSYCLLKIIYNMSSILLWYFPFNCLS